MAKDQSKDPFPKIVKIPLFASKETNRDAGDLLGLSDKAAAEFQYALQNVVFELIVAEDGSYKILTIDGRKLTA